MIKRFSSENQILICFYKTFVISQMSGIEISISASLNGGCGRCSGSPIFFSGGIDQVRLVKISSTKPFAA
jgi:hypothetical protein